MPATDFDATITIGHHHLLAAGLDSRQGRDGIIDAVRAAIQHLEGANWIDVMVVDFSPACPGWVTLYPHGSSARPDTPACRHGISSGLLYKWRKALLAAQPSIARFARVKVTGSAKPADPTPNAVLPPAPAVGTIEIVLPNHTTIRVDAQIDPRALRRVLLVLAKP